MIYQTIEYKNYTININYDQLAENPREMWDNLGTMYCFHNRYSLGDKHNCTIEEVQEMVKSQDYISLPLYLYDHSGITMNTTGFSCPWDSGQVGFIVCEKTEICKQFGWDKLTDERIEKIRKYLISEVETYDDFLTGNVYYYNIPEIDESCGGFYGDNFDKNDLLENAKHSIECHLKRIEQDKINNGIQQNLSL